MPKAAKASFNVAVSGKNVHDNHACEPSWFHGEVSHTILEATLPDFAGCFKGDISCLSPPDAGASGTLVLETPPRSAPTVRAERSPPDVDVEAPGGAATGLPFEAVSRRSLAAAGPRGGVLELSVTAVAVVVVSEAGGCLCTASWVSPWVSVSVDTYTAKGSRPPCKKMPTTAHTTRKMVPNRRQHRFSDAMRPRQPIHAHLRHAASAT
mmetsp:Transcript_43342/g.102034  ORF Transcript_43342/g.102034 Transcript_43342/m.102034 type:complete len:209 (-) Transcript_43342:74-700(-)